ncbi:ribonucleoside-diphosphate reductase alpha chain [Ochrobactrum sp. P20RRXII]|nr:ribonucleotide-diphosphate reductase subunit alpha [Ochrobactrum sp. P20RRXII]NIH77330.1 ribonucleoside-diphosphate reductase alpha chain [Ochrobactrum sp. P20RRXII]
MQREDFYWLNDVSLKTLSRGYLREGIEPENLRAEAIKRLEQMAQHSHDMLIKMGRERKDHAKKLMEGWKRGWASLSTPVMGNFGTQRGLPISCNGSFVADTTESILYNLSEIGMMTKFGAGTSSYMGVRHKGAAITGGGKSSGVVPLMGLSAAMTSTISQAGLRRGNWAGYIDIRSSDIHDFLRIRDPLHPVQHVSFGVCIDDAWMEEMLAEPKNGEKRMLLVDIILKRRQSGFPYIFFTDAANRDRHPRLVELARKIWASNLCTEIMLPANEEESFVCNLSSANAVHYDEWKDTDWIETMIFFLDTVMEEYIEKTYSIPFMDRANRFATRWRALGLGILGYHTALQNRLLPFESEGARAFNIEIHKTLKEQSYAASRKMAEEYGEAPGMTGTGQRHLTLNAIAPTTSSSIILGQVSQSIEPWEGNIFENDNAKGVFTQVNPNFIALLDEYEQNTPEVWKDIARHGGSVQHLDFLSDLEKKVYKTFAEIDQKEIVRQAADRQKYIDQGQSLNLMVPKAATMQDNVSLIVGAWKLGLKSLYYHKNSSGATRELLRATAANSNAYAVEAADEGDCLACQA